MFQYILFDLDGTLTDPKPGITGCVQYALHELGIEEPDLDRLEVFIGPPLVESFIRAAMASVSNTAIVPMQDWLGLGGEARMNVPSRPWGNWQWRVEQSAFTPQLAGRIAALTELYDR